MFVVRPIWKHLLFWVLLAPLLLVESRALGEFLDKLALRDPSRSRQCIAEVTEHRGGEKDNIQIRYHFQIPGDPQQYSASDMTGRRNLWISITPATWEKVLQDNNRVSIGYLLSNPWVNEPVGIAGTPVVDSLFGWGLILAFDVFWAFETYLVVKTFRICRVAADERRECITRFWETREI
jgi:hypothetical protein